MDSMNRLIYFGLVTVLTAACNPSTQNQKEMTTDLKKTGMVEITTFKLNKGVFIKDFGKAALSMQKKFLEKQNGFLKRTLSVSQDSIWTDVVCWADQQSFEKTSALAEKSILVLPFMEKIDFKSVKINLNTPIIIEE